MIATGQEGILVSTATLLLPPRSLYGCVFAAIVRDTRAVKLSDRDRLNFFPASPLVSVTNVREGELRLLNPTHDIEAAHSVPPLPRLFVTSPKNKPTVSWSPGPVLAISVGIYPDAWSRLSAKCDVADLLEQAFPDDNISASWSRFCSNLSDCWLDLRTNSDTPDWNGLPQISDWSRALITRVALSGTGRSGRAFQRRLKRFSGQTKRSLAFFATFEHLHRLSVQAKGSATAQLALDAGYADQSHMGRAVRRATGFSPVQLNRLIEAEEAFWCYRLLGERF